MLVGVVSFNVLKVIPATENRALGVLLVGYAFQGKQMINRHRIDQNPSNSIIPQVLVSS